MKSLIFLSRFWRSTFSLVYWERYGVWVLHKQSICCHWCWHLDITFFPGYLVGHLECGEKKQRKNSSSAVCMSCAGRQTNTANITPSYITYVHLLKYSQVAKKRWARIIDFVTPQTSGIFYGLSRNSVCVCTYSFIGQKMKNICLVTLISEQTLPPLLFTFEVMREWNCKGFWGKLLFFPTFYSLSLVSQWHTLHNHHRLPHTWKVRMKIQFPEENTENGSVVFLFFFDFLLPVDMVCTALYGLLRNKAPLRIPFLSLFSAWTEKYQKRLRSRQKGIYLFRQCGMPHK